MGWFFSSFLGVTPNNFIINMKLEKAKYLLSVTDLNIAEVAYQCGFLDNVYFSYVFKKKEGITPREYRNKFIDLLV